MNSVLVLGAGQIASGYDNPQSREILTHAHALQENKNFRLLGFFDTDKQKAKSAAEKWGVGVFDTPKPADVIVICTPDECHLKSVELAVSLKPKLIVLEKPLARNLTDVKKILKTVKKIPIQVNFSRRFVPELQELAKDIKNFGKFLTGSGWYGKGYIHNGSHLIDLLRFLIGEIKSVEISSQFCDFYNNDPTKTAKISFLDGGEFFMQGVDCRKYSIFEQDIFFENARVRIIESGAGVQIYKKAKSKKFKDYDFLNLSDDYKTQLDFAVRYLYKNIEEHLSSGQSLLASASDVFTESVYV